MASIREHQKKDGSKTFYVLWRDPDTKKQTSLPFPSEAQALELRGLLNEHGQRLAAVEKALAAPPVVEVLTLRGLLEQHLARLTRPAEDTIEGYRKIFENRLGDSHGNLPVSDFTEEVIAAWIKDFMKAGATRKTVANTTGLLSSAFKSGMRRGVVSSNPFDFIELPEDSRTGRRATFLTKPEFDLLQSFVPEKDQLMVETDVNTGLRFSEITALLGDEHLRLTEEIPVIAVERAWKGAEHRKFKIGAPKSGSGVRDVSITLDLAAKLLPRSKRPGLVFPNGRGAQLTSSNFHQTAWQKAVTAAREEGLKKTPRFHDLRHTHASWLLQEGVPIFVVSRRLGHASVDITTRLYGHITPEGHRQAVAGLEKALGRS